MCTIGTFINVFAYIVTICWLFVTGIAVAIVATIIVGTSGVIRTCSCTISTFIDVSAASSVACSITLVSTVTFASESYSVTDAISTSEIDVGTGC